LDKLTLDKWIDVNTAHGIYAMGIFFLITLLISFSELKEYVLDKI